MTHALGVGLASAGIAMVIGSDCPSVDAAYIEEARQALDDVDVVFGPSDDGGYVLIGARNTRPDMLAGVAWGTGKALEQSIAAVQGSACQWRYWRLAGMWMNQPTGTGSSR